MQCVGYDERTFGHSAVSFQLSAISCVLLSAYCLLFLHLIHRLPISCHPIFFTSDFLNGLLVPIERFEIRLQALGFFVGCPDLLDHDQPLMFKPDARYDSPIVEEDVGNKEGSDDHEQGAAPRLEDLFCDALEPAGLLNSPEEIAVHCFEDTLKLTVLQTGLRFEPIGFGLVLCLQVSPRRVPRDRELNELIKEVGVRKS
jgi:hypothetical protein